MQGEPTTTQLTGSNILIIYKQSVRYCLAGGLSQTVFFCVLPNVIISVLHELENK